MLTATTVSLALLLSTMASFAYGARSTPSNAVLLSDIKSLTLRAGQKTSHRRVSAIPQLKCVGGSAKGLFEPEVMRCTNSGSSYAQSDVEWTCIASLPPEFKLGSTDVVCEGYASPEDDHVLKGSCGVEYRLILTELGEEKYGRGGWWKKGQGVFGGGEPAGQAGGRGKQDSPIIPTLFWIIFAGVVIWMLWSAFRNYVERLPPRPRRNGGGWGGGGGGGDDPPPPYTPRSPPPKSYPSSSSWDSGRGGSARGAAGGSWGSWRPGFWTGAATGAAATFLTGGRRAQQTQQPRSSWASPSYGYDPGEGSSRRSGGSSGGGGGFSATRYESSGFGSTRRR